MTSNRPLSIYLNDHLAGATFACELIKRGRDANAGTHVGGFLATLLGEVRQDRAILRGLMAALDITESPLKKAAGWAVEAFSRVKLHEQVTGSAGLTRLMELETLYLGVQGKHALWRTLATLAPSEPRLAGVDFDTLIHRAQQQLEGLERYRIQAAQQAFIPDSRGQRARTTEAEVRVRS